MKLLFQKSLPQSTLSKMEEIGLFMNFLFFVIFWHRKKLLNFFSFSEDEQNSETIDPKKIILMRKIKFGFGKLMVTYLLIKIFIQSKEVRSKILKIGSKIMRRSR